MHKTRSLILTSLVLTFTVLVGWAQLAPVQAAGTTFYIATNGNDANPGTEAQPWLTFVKANNVLKAGDTVLVKNGTYDKQAKTGATIDITHSGTANAYITYKAYPGHRPKIVSSTDKGVAFVNVSYVEFNGFEIQGIPTAKTNFAGDGIWIQDSAHHIRILNNDVWGFGGGGISTKGGDYITIINNRIHGVSKLSPYANSALSLYQLTNFDSASGYHNVIQGNIIYDNENTVPQQRSTGPVITDGNCIIIDTTRHIVNGAAVNPYTGYTLIQNNVCFNNGGRGVHVYQSDNVFAFNNTFYMDQHSADINDGELSARSSGNVQFFNNIVYTLPNKQANQNRSSSNTVFGNNLYFNTNNIPVKASNDLIGADPSFMNGTIDPQSADFRLRQGSPAIDKASTNYIPLVDLLGNIRPFGSLPDLGAYEFVISAPPLPTAPPPPPQPTAIPPLPTGPLLYLDVQPSNAPVGQTVKANLQLKSMTNVFGLDLKCAVNAAVLTSGARFDGTIFTSANSYFVDGGFKADGSWALGASLLNPAPAFTGDGVAISLSYKVVSVGNSTVTCSGLAVDRNGRSLNMTIINGSFNNSPIVPKDAALVAAPAAIEPTIEPLSMIPTLPVVEVPLIADTPTPLPQQPLALPTVAPLIGSVSGFTGYQNRSSQNGIIVQLLSGQTSLAQLVTNADGGFQFTDVPDGSYTIEITAPGHLPLLATADVVGGQPVTLGTLALRSGDADDNGSIDLSDAALIGVNFQLPVPPAPASADLNGDGQINIADLAMLGSNYGSVSPLVQP